MNEELVEIMKPVFDKWTENEIEGFYSELVAAKKQYKNDPEILKALRLALDDKRKGS